MIKQISEERDMNSKEEIDVRFRTIIDLLGDKIYDSPYASMRENLQNAVDAIRIKESNGSHVEWFRPKINIKLDENCFEISDNGNGMDKHDMKSYYWAVGRSGKANMSHICIGTFGIGALANFGVARKLTVISRKSEQDPWIASSLTMDDIDTTPSGQLPKVTYGSPKLSRDSIGTTVKVETEKPLNIKDVKKYICDHAFGLDIPVYLNGDLISKKKIITPPSEFVMKESTTCSWKLFGEEREVECTVYEKEDMTIAVVFEIPGIMNGLALPGSKISTIFNHGFKLCDYPTDSQINFSSIIDCRFFKPTAGRDSLNSESADQFRSLVNKLSSLLADIASKSNGRLRAMPQIFYYGFIYGESRVFDNLLVQVENHDDLTLHEIERRCKTNERLVFYTDKSSRIAKGLSAKGHIVVLLPQGSHEAFIVTKYLKKYCDGQSIRKFDAIESLIAFDELSADEIQAIKTLEISLAELLDTSIEVIPALLTENFIFHWPESIASENEQIYFNIKHNDIQYLLKDLNPEYRPRQWQILKEMLLNNLGEMIFKFRKKLHGDEDEIGIKAYLEAKYKIYNLTVSDVQRVGRSRQSIIIEKDDVQRVREDRLDKLPDLTGKVVFISSSFENASEGCFIKLHEAGHRLMKPLDSIYGTFTVLWSGTTLFYFYKIDEYKVFMTTMEFDKFIKIEGKGEYRDDIDESRRPIFLPDKTYLPVPQVMERYVMPINEEQIITLIIRSKLPQFDA